MALQDQGTLVPAWTLAGRCGQEQVGGQLGWPALGCGCSPMPRFPGGAAFPHSLGL